MKNKYDVIVVGAGNAGLVAAATAAKSGLKTLLVEKHNLPGGCASSFVRGRFEFEPSLHELASVGTPEHPDSVDTIFRDLGADVTWYHEKNCFRSIVTSGDGYDVTIKAGVEEFCDSIESYVPGSRESVHAIFDLINKCNEAIAYITKMKGKPNSLVMILKHRDFMRCASHSVTEVLTALGVPKKAQDIICTYWGYLGVPADELNAFHFFNMLKCYAVDGAAMPEMKSHELSLALVKVIQDHGGEVWYNSFVKEFLFDENKKCIGVKINSEEYYADEIISNIIPHNVFNMTDIKNIPEKDLKLANAREFGISVFTIYLGMDCTAEELGMTDYTTFISSSRDTRKQYDERNDGSIYIVNCLNKVIPQSSPEGTCTLFFTALVNGSDLPEDLKPETYKKWKNELAGKYIEQYEKLTGKDIRSHIEEIEIATPVTFARYLGTPDGTIYGYKLSKWDNMLSRISNEAAEYTIPGLSFVGGHAFRGDGYSSAYVTGDTVGKRIVRKLKGGK